MKQIKITNLTNKDSSPIIAKYCRSFFCQLRGLMFTRSIPEDHGLLLVQKDDNRLNASIHMMFMWMDLGVIWINSDYTVVDLVLAHRWKLGYLPKKPAKYVLETGVPNLSHFQIGNKVHFEELPL